MGKNIKEPETAIRVGDTVVYHKKECKVGEIASRGGYLVARVYLDDNLTWIPLTDLRLKKK